MCKLSESNSKCKKQCALCRTTCPAIEHRDGPHGTTGPDEKNPDEHISFLSFAFVTLSQGSSPYYFPDLIATRQQAWILN